MKAQSKTPLYFLKWLPNGRLLVIEELTVTEKDELLKKHSITKVMNPEKSNVPVHYLLNNGQVLGALATEEAQKEGATDNWCLLDSEEEFQLWFASRQNYRSASYPELYKRNPYGQDFPQKTIELIDILKKDLDIIHKEVDKELLIKLDIYFAKLPPKQRLLLAHQYFLHLLAVIGEVLCNAHPSLSWKMHKHDVNFFDPLMEITYSPYLIVNNDPNKYIEFLSYLCEDFFDNYATQPTPLTEVYESSEDILNIFYKKK